MRKSRDNAIARLELAETATARSYIRSTRANTVFKWRSDYENAIERTEKQGDNSTRAQQQKGLLLAHDPVGPLPTQPGPRTGIASQRYASIRTEIPPNAEQYLRVVSL